MRLIDADELIEFINGRISDGSEDHASQYTIIQDETLMEIGSKVKSMPTVDAEPVKYAHAVWTKPNIGYQTQCCSNCHRTPISRPDETIQFCPHCGAKMDEEVKK